jgi:ABC-type phosphate transport system auxiliary subunit
MNFLKRIWNVWFIQWSLTAKAISIGVLAVLLIIVIVGVRSCGKSKPKLNEAEIQQGEAAKKAANDKELREILVQSDAREKEIEANVIDANSAKVNAIQESREKWANANRDELQAEFDRRAAESK